MLRLFDRNGRELPQPADGTALPVAEIGWFDLDNPTLDEERRVEAAIGVEIPSRDELRDIEPSSRLYTENGALYLTASLAYRAETPLPGLTDVGFILAEDRLVTIRYAEPRAFKIFIAGLARAHECLGGTDIFVRLLETIVDRSAELLEQAGLKIDDLTTRVFHTEGNSRPDIATRDLEATLSEIALLQRLVAKIRESLMSLSRVATFLQTPGATGKDKKTRETCRSISRDIQSLSEHAGFLSGNIIFLLDACLGLISVQQNRVIKVLSIAALVLLPPTFIGTIYGMNFQHMPELAWTWGYPAALAAMVGAALLPFLWFRRKGWL